MRQIFVKLHLWLGLSIGLLWALQGLSGSWLVFHREVEHAGLAVEVGPMTSLNTILANAKAARKTDPIRISIADKTGDILDVTFKKGHEPLKLAAFSGRVLALEPTLAERINETLYKFHEEVLSGERGKNLVGISGLVLMSSGLMGIALGWPKRRSRVAAFTPGQWKTTKMRLYGWHRASGLLACSALAVCAVTGATMIWAKDLRSAFAAAVPYETPYRPKPVKLLRSVVFSPDQALAIAKMQFPTAGFVRLMMPTKEAPVYQFRLHQSGEIRAWSGVTSVTVDPFTGTVLDTYDPLQAPISNWWFDAVFPLHNGEALGLIGRLLVGFAGLSLPMFYVTGVFVWWRTRRRGVHNIDVGASAAI